MDQTTFVEKKFISISLSGLIKFFLGSRFASFLLLLAVHQHCTFIWGMQYVLYFKMLTFCQDLFLPVTHPSFTFYPSVLLQLQRNNTSFTLRTLTTYKLASVRSHLHYTVYNFTLYPSALREREWWGISDVLSSWATSHRDWGSTCLWICCKSLYSHTYFDFEWLFLVSLILFLINLR